MAINFPNTPSDGDTHVVGDVTFTYDAAKNSWLTVPSSSGGSSVVVSDTPPVSPNAGDMWTDSETMKLNVYYVDSDSSQWVEVSGSSTSSGSSSGSGVTMGTDDPLITNNGTLGELWLNTTSGELYACTDATVDANIWNNIGDGTGNITPNDPPTNPTNTSIADQSTNATFDYTFTGGTDTDGTVTHYIVDEITGTSGGNVVSDSLTVALAEVPVGVPHQFTVGSLSDTTSISFRVRSKDNNDSYSTGVTITFSGTLPSYFGGRGLWAGGHDATWSFPNHWKDTIDYVTISTTGNAIDFGNLTKGKTPVASCSSGTRGLWAGGSGVTGASNNIAQREIDYVTISTLADASNFGQLLRGEHTGGMASCSDGVRGLFSGGWEQTAIEHVTLATTSNTGSFGNLTHGNYEHAGCSNGVRGIFGGGRGGGDYWIEIDYVAISTLSDAADFGDLTGRRGYVTACSDGTKGLFGGGFFHNNIGNLNEMQYINIDTLGNATDFGDLSVGSTGLSSCSDGTKGLFGGFTGPSNVIDYVTMSTLSNAYDFGDLTLARNQTGSCSGD